MANDRTFRLDDETVDALCASAEARALLHPGDEVDTAALRREADALIAGRARRDTMRRLEAMIDGTPRLLPPGFPELLTHMGIDARAVLGLVLAVPDSPVAILKGDIPVVRLDFNQSGTTWILLDERWRDDETPSLTWRDTEIIAPGIPETVGQLLTGRPLEALMDHPALRPLGLTITKVRPLWEDATYTEIETSLHAARQAEEDLVTARVRAVLEDIASKTDDAAQLKVRPMGGVDPGGVMYGFGPFQLGINPELVRLHTDEELRILLLGLIDEWRESR